MASRPPDHSPPSPDPARARFAIINAIRAAGMALVVLGVLVLNYKIDLPQTVGWVFLLVGLIDVFVVPQVLARKWRTPPA